MKVKELIEILKGSDQNSEVIMAKDEEGNGFSPLAEAENNGVYTPDSTWSGERFDCSWSPEDACLSNEEHAEMMKKKKAVFLWPTN